MSAVKKANKRKKNKRVIVFFKTFSVFLIIFTLIFTPVSYCIEKFLTTNPFQAEGEETIDFDVMVDNQSPYFREFSDSSRVNILVLGVNPPLADTIMLVSFDPESKHVDVISVPRDTYYHRDGYNDLAQKKINASYRGNPENIAKAVSDVLLGIPINYYAVVEYDDVEKIVDEMGGVPMYIDRDMVYNDPYDNPPLKISLKKGQQILDGKDSVKFLRYRKGYVEGDIGRVKAQQNWVKNAMTQALEYGIVKVAKVAFQELDSNITYKAMLSLGTTAIGLKSENIKTYTIPFEADPNPPYYVYPKNSELEDMIKEIYSIQPDIEVVDSEEAE